MAKKRGSVEKKTKKKSSKNIIILAAVIIVAIVILYIVINPGSPGANSQTSNFTNCQNYKLSGGTSKPLELNNSYVKDECPNAPGAILGGYYGSTLAIWTIQNPNNVSLKIPCNIIATETNVSSRALINEKTVKSIKVNVPSGGTVLLNETFSLPKCYNTFRMDCNPVYTLPECA